MATSNSEFGAHELLLALTSGNGTMVLGCLAEIDSRQPVRSEAELLKKAFDETTDPVLSFQIKKSLRLAVFKLKGTHFKVSLAGLEKLLEDPARYEDLALGITTIEAAEAFLAADCFRTARWQNFPAEILPTFCLFFKKHGSIEDSPALIELTRHPDSTVITAALAALEKLDPVNLQGIIIPLLNSPQNVIKAQAIQAFYRWNRAEALKHLVKLLLSTSESEVVLALHHAAFFPFPEIEPHLIRLLTQVTNPSVLMRISQILKNNAHAELPFRIYWVIRSLDGQHQSLVKGILLGIVRALADRKLIEGSVQDYLNQLKEKVRREELSLLKETCQISTEEGEAILPTLEEFDAPPVELSPGTSPEARPAASGVEGKKTDGPPPVVKPVEIDFENYNSLSEQDRVQLLARGNAAFFAEHKGKLSELLSSAQGKELAAVITIFGKYGKMSECERIKKLVKNENPDIICACIKALSTLDSEHLCLYLPQFMQEKNGKVRMTATRVFVGIDRDRIKSLLTSMIGSANTKQRSLAVSTSMLVDFNIVRQPLLDALAKETSVEIIEKLGVVLATNPDRELLASVYKISLTSRTTLRVEQQRVVQMLAEKLAIALNHISPPEELIKETQQAYEEEIKAAALAKEKADAERRAAGLTDDDDNPEQDSGVNSLLSSETGDAKTTRAKVTVLIWMLVAIIWGGGMALLFLKLVTGE
ncbi:MAG TPA: HEAT repeat domain-containing protein [Candidatus Rifleibacterium sp.]|nr:HEAT repeat domain-containing protein [Candidatus Rifleibacterium sp.]HPT45529.1 HEAT repeat domain-containing protein [Candidatus Rifleibacterium sp.]